MTATTTSFKLSKWKPSKLSQDVNEKLIQDNNDNNVKEEGFASSSSLTASTEHLTLNILRMGFPQCIGGLGVKLKCEYGGEDSVHLFYNGLHGSTHCPPPIDSILGGSSSKYKTNVCCGSATKFSSDETSEKDSRFVCCSAAAMVRL